MSKRKKNPADDLVAKAIRSAASPKRSAKGDELDAMTDAEFAKMMKGVPRGRIEPDAAKKGTTDEPDGGEPDIRFADLPEDADDETAFAYMMREQGGPIAGGMDLESVGESRPQLVKLDPASIHELAVAIKDELTGA